MDFSHLFKIEKSETLSVTTYDALPYFVMKNLNFNLIYNRIKHFDINTKSILNYLYQIGGNIVIIMLLYYFI